MTQPRDPFDEDDYFADTRMSFGEHIEDLRKHLVRAALWLSGFLVLGFALDGLGTVTGWKVLGYDFGVGKPAMALITQPVDEQLGKFYDKRKAEIEKQWREDVEKGTIERRPVTLIFDTIALARMGVPNPPADGAHIDVLIDPTQVGLELNAVTKKLGKRPGLSTLSAQEAILAYFKVTLVVSLILASPMVFWEIWAFVAAGLYPTERRYVHVYMPFSIGLFLGGVALCEFFVLPRAVGALLMFNEWLGLEPELRFNEWLSLAIWMPVIFGLSFQTPLVMLFMQRIGLFDAADYRRKRRYAFFIIVVVAAIFLPTPDGMSVVMLAGPMCLLYELGIRLCEWSPRPTWDDVTESEQVAGV
jgi:sec-independent protein translocase protein TatC